MSNKAMQLEEIIDLIFDTGDVYWCSERGSVIWACRPIAVGPTTVN